MSRIDLHTHILPKTWPDWTARSGYAGWVALEHHSPGCANMVQSTPGGGKRVFREVQANLWDPAVRIGEMDATGVSTQVLSTVPVMFSSWAAAKDALELHRFLNDHIAGVCRANPGRFEGLGAIPMQDAEMACREMERCVSELGLRGVQIGTNVNGLNLDDPSVRVVLKHAATIGACVFVHPWDMLGESRMKNYWMPWLVGMPTETTIAMMSVLMGGVMEEAAGLRMCFAHASGSFAGTIGRIIHGFECRRDLFPATAKHPREYLADTAKPDSFAKVWVDSLTHDVDALASVVRLFGARRVAMGSDYPFPLGEDCPGKLIETMTSLSVEQKRLMQSGSAREFLGLS